MARENSFSDSDGRSLTPEMDEEATGGAAPISPTYSRSHADNIPAVQVHSPRPIKPEMSRVRSETTASKAPEMLPGFDPKKKWQTLGRKVIQIHRSTTMLTTRGVGAEPGVNPRRASADQRFGHIKDDCVIEIVDYSAVRCSVGRMENKQFADLLKDHKASAQESWVKVRWINIRGISWDVIKAVAIKYDLHDLAIEDVVHQRGQARSKVDYYHKHLFLRVLCHQLAKDGDDVGQFLSAYASPPPAAGNLTDLPRSSSPVPFTDEDKEGDLSASGSGLGMDDDKTMYGGSAPASQRGMGMATLVERRNKRRRPLLPNHRRDLENARRATGATQMEASDAARQERIKEDITVEELKKGARVPVKVSPMFIFLLRDGTVISMSSGSNGDLTAPITARIRQSDTILRTSADPSLLVQSLLDLLVDQALEVIDEYHLKIKKFEHTILLRPSVKAVRDLHILSGDLILHKRTLEPIKTIIYGLRRYDLDRCAALIDQSTHPDAKVVGFMSHKAKIYLADVFDHMEYILTSLDMFAGISENLIDYTFNMASYEMNEVMRRLTLATIIFLPLTLLTGYFGMNFDNMWTIHHNHTDVVFWIIALPVMAIVAPLFMWNDIVKAVHYIKKRMAAKKVVKTYKQA